MNSHIGISPKHYLMALYFLNEYSTEVLNATKFQCDEKTFRLHSWRVVELLSKLDFVSWEKRNEGGNQSEVIRMSIDGTDCRIEEQYPFDKKWFSHKFKGPGIRYEVGVSINGNIVWVYGGFPCGEWSDLKIAQDAVLELLDDGEKVIADSGYRGDHRIVTPNGINDSISRIRSILRARHETVNSRLKSFNVLSHRYRHNLRKHPLCFHAIANLIQVQIMVESPLFNINETHL